MGVGAELRGGPSYEFGDEAGGPGGTVGLHRPVVDRAADLGVGGGVVHPPARPVAVQAVGDVEVLLEVVGEGKYRNGRRFAVSSMHVVSPPCTTARSQAARCR